MLRPASSQKGSKAKVAKACKKDDTPLVFENPSKPVSLLDAMTAAVISFSGKRKCALEVMCGSGIWADYIAKHDGWQSEKSDIEISDLMDFTKPAYVCEVGQRLDNCEVGALQLGLDCRTWSTAPHCYRNPDNIFGFDDLAPHL